MTKKRVLFLISYIALALLFVFDLVLMFCIIGMKEATPLTGGVVINPNATDKGPDGGQSAAQGVTVAGFSSLTIPHDVNTIAIDLYNPIENLGLFYMTFELRLLNDSEQGFEVLYNSKLEVEEGNAYLAPGMHITQITLSHSLPAGTYKAQLLIQPYRMSDLSPTNNVSAEVNLTVI